ncbi:MAG: hypothetical protein Kow00108_06130 [Calditrichia bacterium]
MSEFILIVDDDETTRVFLERLVTGAQYKAICAGSGLEALTLLKQNKIWATIVDDNMPGMSGKEFLKEARKINQSMINLLVTGYSKIDTIIECLNLNLIYKYFQKPVDADLLIPTLQEMEMLYTLKKKYMEGMRNVNTMQDFPTLSIDQLHKIYEQLFIDNLKLIQMGQFTISLLDQISNPIQVIKLNLEYMRKNKKYSDIAINQIDLNVDAIKSTLKIILNNFSKNSTKEKQQIHLEEFIENILETNKLLLKHPEHFQFNVEIASDISKIYFSPRQLEHICNSLIQNAIEASYRSDKPEIRIQAYKSNSYFYMKVIDNGIGIAPEYHEKIFDPFFSTKSREMFDIWKENMTRTGMGLWLTNQLIREQKGSLSFRSEPDRTEFLVEIPLKSVLIKRT